MTLAGEILDGPDESPHAIERKTTAQYAISSQPEDRICTP
jgi:hypothetical protein